MADSAKQKRMRNVSTSFVLAASFLLHGCSSGGSEGSENTPLADSLTFRFSDDTNPIFLSARGASSADDRQVRVAFSADTLEGGNNQTDRSVWVGIDALPIQPHQRTIVVSATDGQNTDEVELNIDVQPTSAPDIYLLVGQSNMIGFSGDGPKLAGPGQPDEPNERIKQLHVTYNDENNQFTDESAFRSVQRNIVSPAIITAEDPLHEPLNPSTNRKDNNYIVLGISFAKAALNDTTADVVLVPAAWSGSAFCEK